MLLYTSTPHLRGKYCTFSAGRRRPADGASDHNMLKYEGGSGRKRPDVEEVFRSCT